MVSELYQIAGYSPHLPSYLFSPPSPPLSRFYASSDDVPYPPTRLQFHSLIPPLKPSLSLRSTPSAAQIDLISRLFPGLYAQKCASGTSTFCPNLVLPSTAIFKIHSFRIPKSLSHETDSYIILTTLFQWQQFRHMRHKLRGKDGWKAPYWSEYNFVNTAS